jgi:ribosomal small subunit protein bTHX
MGRGDKRTRKGKIFSRSYGKKRLGRPAKKAKPAAAK